MMSKKGFTLVELAIVLIIVGVLTAGGVKMIYSAMDSSKFTSTRNQVESIIKEIAEYSGRARRIPSDFAELSGIVSPTADSFGNDVYYLSDTALTGTDSICNASSTDITVTEGSTEYNNIAFFVSSDSINELRQISVSGTDITIYDDTQTIGGQEYDDITGWLTLDSLKRYAGCEGASMSIIENALPKGYVESTYSTELNPKGGAGGYTWCAESTNSNIRSEFQYAGRPIISAGSRTDGTNDDTDFTGTDTLVISSPTDLTAVIPASSKLRVYLRDSDGFTVFKDYSLRVAQEYELVLTDSTIPEDDDEDDSVDSTILWEPMTRTTQIHRQQITITTILKTENLQSFRKTAVMLWLLCMHVSPA